MLLSKLEKPDDEDIETAGKLKLGHNLNLNLNLNYKQNLSMPTDLQTKPGASVSYLEITPQPCNFISEYPRCAQQVVAEQETFKTPTEALYAESETKGYVAGIVANKDSPPDKSMETEAKVSMPLVSKSVGSRADVDVATDEEEGKDLKSGKKLCKIHDVKRTETWTRCDNVTVAQSGSINLSPEHESSSTCPESEIKPAVSCVLNDVLKLQVKSEPIYGRSQVLENERMTCNFIIFNS